LETSSVRELYDCYAQNTSLRWPMYIVVSKDKEISEAETHLKALITAK
jgi:hypothetical protein